MKNKLLCIITALVSLIIPKVYLGQAPNLGTAADFVLFSSVGAIGNTGISHVTGNVGTNSGAITGFGNVNGQMHSGDLVTAQCSADLLIAYGQLSATVPGFFPAPLLGNGQVLVPGVHLIAGPATLNSNLTLDAQGDPDAVFIIRINGAFGVNANANVQLLNGALACNVFWQVGDLVSIAAGATMRGNIINNGSIHLGTGATLEGRALSIAGQVTIDGILAYTPIGCGSPVLTGPASPDLNGIGCFALFSSNGPVTNTGVTTVYGDVGTNSGLTTGYDPLLVTGEIHPNPDGSTAQAASDLTDAYAYLNTLPYDIELLYPAQFGNSLVLTPHTYLMNAAVTFTDTVFLNARGNPDAVFVIQVNGAFTTSTFAIVTLINGTQAKNVYWKIDGATNINGFSEFKGTIIGNNGAINLASGATIIGRALTTTGALNTTAMSISLPSSCSPFTITEPVNQTACEGSSASFTVVATGDDLTYQWRKGNVNLNNGGSISGATSATLTINPVTASDAALNYNVIITGGFTPSDTSSNVSLTVLTAPVITTQPADQTVCITGGTAIFTAAATGNGLSYQWRRGIVNLVDGASISGATTSTLTINPVTPADAATNYNVVITGTCSPTVVSDNASLVLTALPLANASSNSPVCTGGPIQLDAGTVAGATYLWTGPNSFTSVNQHSVIPSAAISDAGNYSLTVLVNGCNSLPATVAVLVVVCSNDLSIVKTADSMEPLIGKNIVFTITASNNGPDNSSGVTVSDTLHNGYTYISSSTTTGTYDAASGTWTIGDLLNGETAVLTITASVNTSGDYVNTAYIDGNEAEANLVNNRSSVEPFPTDFFIPEGFSPNGDAINDLFVIRGIQYFPSNTFEIFNRWGNKIFEISPYQNSWNGKSFVDFSLGDELPVGLYFYILDLGDDSPALKGTIYLNR
ncbi:MAG: hypothetical protein K0R65_2950 [Crocinitomicaceae bacterium]|jgi:gliding motility-associated-like protein/uncharacterized repeat protein (TIGR01451 family)|nr:hypothetical protein [Crocinitomicaceae bacterium]